MFILFRKLFPGLKVKRFWRFREHILGRLDILEFFWRGKISSLPRRLELDPGNLCNLRCPLCPTGSRKLAVEQEFTPFERFKVFLEQQPNLEILSLVNWGEPFLNADTIAMIAHAHSRGICVDVHTNFSLKLETEFFERLALSGLDMLVVSIDGVTQETYEKFRVRGDLSLALSNIEKLKTALDRNKISSMQVVWKFIVSRFNEHEVDAARAHAQKLGVDFLTSTINLNDYYPNMPHSSSLEERKAKWLPHGEEFIRPYYRGGGRKSHYLRGCPHLISRPVINPQGHVAPCCYITEPSGFFGNTLSENFKNIWNNSDFALARSYFYPSRKKIVSDKKLPCEQCHLFQRNTSLWRALKSYRP